MAAIRVQRKRRDRQREDLAQDARVDGSQTIRQFLGEALNAGDQLIAAWQVGDGRLDLDNRTVHRVNLRLQLLQPRLEVRVPAGLFDGSHQVGFAGLGSCPLRQQLIAARGDTGRFTPLLGKEAVDQLSQICILKQMAQRSERLGLNLFGRPVSRGADRAPLIAGVVADVPAVCPPGTVTSLDLRGVAHEATAALGAADEAREGIGKRWPGRYGALQVPVTLTRLLKGATEHLG